MLRAAALALSVVLAAACGGSSKSTAPPDNTSGGGEPEPAAAGDCCCDFIEETGDPTGDEWSENQVYRTMEASACADFSGECVDAATCAAAAEE